MASAGQQLLSAAYVPRVLKLSDLRRMACALLLIMFADALPAVDARVPIASPVPGASDTASTSSVKPTSTQVPVLYVVRDTDRRD